jgi:drug/metabolite transporter (DMT)-like permease
MNGDLSFGLLSAFFSGAGDVCGGVATRRARPLCVVLMVQTAGAALLLAAALASGQPLPQWSDAGWSAAAGMAGCLGLLALYTALGSGQMGVVAPLSAVIAALVPIMAGALLEGAPRPAQMAGFAVALPAIWLLTQGGQEKGSQRALSLALAAGLGFGCYFVLIDQAGAASGLWNLGVSRACPAVVLLALMLAFRHPILPPLSVLPLNVLNGALDVSGSVCFVLAVQIGRLDVVSVLASLYPAATIALAWLLLGERMKSAHVMGAAAAFVSIALIVL